MEENNTFDVVIIGAGVAGSYTAKLLAEQGITVLVLEEHREVGRPLQCAGLVTPRVFDLVSDKIRADCLINEVSGAKIYSPTGKELIIDAGKTKGLVIDRIKFDQGIIKEAILAGAQLMVGAKAIDAKQSGKLVSVKYLMNGKSHEVATKLVIAADGVQSQVARWFGLKTPKFIVSGFGAEMTGVDIEPDYVEIYLGNKVSPNFFTWVIPKSNCRTNGYIAARVGLACRNTKKPAYQYYLQLFSHPILGPKLRSAKPVQYLAGGVPIGTVTKSYHNNLMLVGDAAGQVKPTSGGGIYIGLMCSKYCSETAKVALDNDDLSVRCLRRYQKCWQDVLGKELKHGMRLHKVYMHLTDDQLEEGFHLLNEPGVLDIISNEGDIDYPSKVTKRLFKSVPQLLKFAKPYLRSFF
jgi:digeranylgeranylglycerophospholipid reductase